ncbi:putative glutathione transferase [Dioszegia hungarica]|uniref:Glutathione transferase n=1 Tax=Dioszegia hungarica TaxID=4972 RepID=A0AA38H7Y4_9TREE|nr:putative glutathione transferase [Dioszegia hungarica]KAI9635405.1 putative glutathione transferase [Dioszegia hungarica]
MASAKQFVDEGIKKNHVMVYGKSYCPYCQRAKKLLEGETSEMEYIDLDKRDDGSDIQAYLKQLNGQGTVPHVYIGQEFIGGCSELQAVPKDELKKKLSKK